MAYASFEEMAKLRPGGIDEADRDRAEALLDEASTLVDECAGPFALADWASIGSPPKAIKSVCIQVALRVFENPGGLTMEQATGYMYQRPQNRVTGLELTPRERARVRAAVGRAGVYSVRTPSGVDETSIGTIMATDTVT